MIFIDILVEIPLLYRAVQQPVLKDAPLSLGPENMRKVAGLRRHGNAGALCSAISKGFENIHPSDVGRKVIFPFIDDPIIIVFLRVNGLTAAFEIRRADMKIPPP